MCDNPSLKIAVDVHYRAEEARAAGVLFHAWDAPGPAWNVSVEVSGTDSYQPGEFFRRELPPIMALLDKVDPLPDVIVVDGYVCLDAEGKPGLGKYLYDALGGKCAVIGVAKSRYRGTPVEAELRRGGSDRPLYITAAGVSQEEAKACIRKMRGGDRIPRLLKEADRLSRSWD